MRWIGGWLLWVALAPAAVQAAGVVDEAHGPVDIRIVGDAIPAPLTAEPGDAVRGRAIVVNRQQGLCLLCHSGPFAEERPQADDMRRPLAEGDDDTSGGRAFSHERFQGTLAPSLAGAGARWSAAQLRLRLVDGRRLNPESLMPAYYRRDGLARVGSHWQGQTILSAQQIEDVVAFLTTLRE